MPFSIQTNVNSMVAQENMRVNNQFQSRTIQRLTSGYRINNSGDDAAGLAVANQFRSQTAELTQGVRNANDGISQLQIVDGGLSNISTMLDRLTTLATQSASSTFTGDRNTLNSEYQQLVSEITRQASNVGLNAGGANNNSLSVYLGGGRNSTQVGSSAIDVDLSGTANAVDAASLKLNNTSVAGGGVDLGAVTVNDAIAGGQAFTINYADGTSATITPGAGLSLSDAIKYLNTNDKTVAAHGISFAVDGSNELRVSGSQAFSIDVAAGGATTLLNSGAAVDKVNTAMYNQTEASAFAPVAGGAEVLNFSTQSGSAQVSLAIGTDLTGTLNAINSNSQVKALGITAVVDGTGAKITFQSAGFFNLSVDDTNGPVTAGVAAMGAFTAADTSASLTGTANAALASINTALKSLGLVQGKVGAGENKLQYAINLAQSQISNFSAAESQIRDADIASEAANLTKAQVLQQSSIAAMAQANSAPQAILKLLQ
jgi:flagellin